MLIRCPDCNFEREINTANIPASATLATCPRCGTKFRFRDPETGEFLFAEGKRPELRHIPGGKGHTPPEGEHEEPAGAAFPAEPPHLPTEMEGDDPLPPGAVIPRLDDRAPEEDAPLVPGASSPTPGWSPENRKPVSEVAPKAASDVGQTEHSVPSSLVEQVLPETPSVPNFPDEPDARDVPSPAAERTRAPEEGRALILPSQEEVPVPPPAERAAPRQETRREAVEEEDSGEEYFDARSGEEAVVPWENPEIYGFLGSFVHTLLQAMFRPASFFRAVGRSEGSLARPLVFFLLLEFISTLFWVIWIQGPMKELIASAPTPEIQAVYSQFLAFMSTPLFLLLVPFVSLLVLFFMALFYYAFLRLAQPDRIDFGTVVKVLSYSTAPRILFVVPFLGMYVGFLWGLALSFIGCRYAFGMSWAKVALALVPLYLLGMALNMRLLALVAGSGVI